MKKAVSILVSAAVVFGIIYAGVNRLNGSDILPEEFRVQPKTAVFTVAEHESYYYYNRLSYTEKQVYTAVREKIFEFPDEIETPELSEDGLANVLNALMYDDTMLFMFKTCTQKTVGSKCSFVPKYIMTRSEYESVKAQLEAKLTEIERSAPNGSVYDKELYFHDTIIEMCDYIGSNEQNGGNVAGALLEGKVTCAGYSKAFKLLLDRAGINNVLVTGTAYNRADGSQSHMWNAVEIDSRWYFVDVTWDDPTVDNEQNTCRHTYFNVTADMLKESHYGYEFDYSCVNTDLFYYAVNNAYFSSFDDSTKSGITELIVSAVKAGETSVDFMFTEQNFTQNAIDELFDGQGIYRILEKANLQTEAELVTDSVKYTVDYDSNLIELFFQIKD